MPANNTKYYLFHTKRDDENTVMDSEFLYTVVEFEDSEDSGKVLSKNQQLLNGDFTDQVTAVRHGNGRDWWVVLPKRSSNRHYFFLLDPTGPKLKKIQDVGHVWAFEDFVGQAVFSPDGSKYIRISAMNGVNIFDFDRCSGVLSNPVHISLAGNGLVPASATGVSVSPNNRFLYASAGDKVFQYDLEAADIGASKVLVAEYDGFMTLGVIPTLFYQHKLAPDGKIYIVPPGSCGHLHVIHEPSEKGLACDLRQHDLELAALESWGMPNFPHFRTYDLDGSPCDSLGIDGPVAAAEKELPDIGISVYPNPATTSLTLELPAPLPAGAVWSLHAATGQSVRQQELATGQTQHTIPLAGLPPGLYFWEVRSEGRRVGSGKVVLIR